MADGASARHTQVVDPRVAWPQQKQKNAAQPDNLYPDEYCPPQATHRAWPGKRVLDLIGAIGLAIVLSPIIVGITLVLAASEGPVLFRHQRVGRNGKRFICYKFRTMVPDAEARLKQLFRAKPQLREEWVQDHKLKNDPRVTRFGAWLRRTSLDELPQLVNVLRGEMSLVGPRPIVDEEIFRYGRAYRHYVAVKPGLTGMWQVNGRTDTTYTRRVALDRLYAMHSCLFLDLKILARTARTVLARKGAY